MITLTDVEALRDNEAADPQTRMIAAHVAEAMNDWPDPVQTVEDFIAQLEANYGSVLNRTTFEQAANDPRQAMWKREALASLLLLWKDHPDDKDIRNVLAPLLGAQRRPCWQVIVWNNTSKTGEPGVVAHKIFRDEDYATTDDLLTAISTAEKELRDRFPAPDYSIVSGSGPTPDKPTAFGSFLAWLLREY